MNKKNIIKALVIVGAIVVIILILLLLGSNMMGMIKDHMGL